MTTNTSVCGDTYIPCDPFIQCDEDPGHESDHFDHDAKVGWPQ